jgi:hypothetical protein
MVYSTASLCGRPVLLGGFNSIEFVLPEVWLNPLTPSSTERKLNRKNGSAKDVDSEKNKCRPRLSLSARSCCFFEISY